MRVLFFGLICLFCQGLVCGQEFQHVDDLTSFENLRFGCKPQDLPGRLTLDLTISYGLKYYKYSHQSTKLILGHKTYDINLGFNNDELEYIDIYYNKLTKEEFDALRRQLEVRFGAATLVDALEKGVVQSVQWKGNSVTIDLYQFGEEAVDEYDVNKTILAIAKPL